MVEEGMDITRILPREARTTRLLERASLRLLGRLLERG